MKHTLLVLAGCGLLVCGCASGKATTGEPARPSVSEVRGPAGANRALLFDDYPGYYRADDFAGRTDWPSADGYYQPSEIVYFREHMVDYQGRNVRNRDWSYRRFDSYREGVSY